MWKYFFKSMGEKEVDKFLEACTEHGRASLHEELNHAEGKSILAL